MSATPPTVTGKSLLDGPLLQHSAGVVVAKVVGAGCGLAFNIALARILGPELAGVYFLALLVATVATVMGRGGLDNVVLRFAAIAESRQAEHELAGLRRKARKVALWLSVPIAAILIVGSPLIADQLFDEPRLTLPLRLVALAIPFGALTALDLEVLKGIGRARLSAVLETVPGPLLGLVLLLLLAIPYGLAGAALAHVFTGAALAVTAAVLIRRARPGLPALKGDFDTGVLVRTAVPLFWVALLALVMGIVDTAMLGILADSREVGIFGIAARVAALTSFGLHAVNMVVAPRFAALHSAGRTDEMERVARLAAAAASAVGLPVVLACVAFPTLVLALFGPGFVAGAPVLATLAVGHLVNALTGPVGYLLMMTGHERTMRNNMVATGALNIGLNAWLIPGMGALGAAIGTAVSLTVLNLASAVLVHRRLRVLVLPVPVGR